MWIGSDLLVYIRGGEKPHIGAVAAATPRPSLKDNQIISATASVLTYVGHKEDVTVKFAAEALSAALNTRVVVTAGIHWDNLNDSGIQTIQTNTKALVTELIETLKTKGEAN